MTESGVVGWNEDRDTRLPRVFGRYLLLQRLSRGGMGEIFLAKLGEIQGFEKLVIIKKVLPHLVADDEFIKRFIDEAKLAIKLQHVNVGAVFEVGKVDDEYFLVIEYIEGRDLRRVIAQQRAQNTQLPVDLCLFICRELTNGLAYAHRRTDDDGSSLALVHRDISPPNVMVSFEGEVKIIDFGIAKSAIRLAASRPDMGFGKFGYMAPEQLVRGGKLDRRTDVYAAGVVLYELLTGDILFPFVEGADYRAIAAMVTAGKIVPPSQRDPRLDPAIDAIVMKALATRPHDRYQTAEEFRDALQSHLMQRNPTINADALAEHVRVLFQEELSGEHHMVSDLKAVDVEPFRNQLKQASVRHTVTFARAPMGKKRRRSEAPALALARRHARPVLLFFVAACSAMVAGGGITLGLLRASTNQPAQTAPAVVTASRSPEAATPSAPVPAEAPTPVEHRPAREHPSRHAGARAHRPQREPAARRPSSATVERKFSRINGEYSRFKSEYGAVLDGRWNAIAHEAAFGKSEKIQRLDVMLDALRRAMAAVRAR